MDYFKYVFSQFLLQEPWVEDGHDDWSKGAIRVLIRAQAVKYLKASVFNIDLYKFHPNILAMVCILLAQ